MKKSKEQKAREKLAAMLGIDAPPSQSLTEQHDSSMEAEAVLEYAENPRSFTHKKCKLCNREFATRGAPVAYCSNTCRAESFEKRLGIRWSPDRRPEDRWGFMGEPLTVPPEALPVVQAVLAEREVEPEPEPEPEPTAAELTDNLLDMMRDLGIE
jgi:hypothetical protein